MHVRLMCRHGRGHLRIGHLVLRLWVSARCQSSTPGRAECCVFTEGSCLSLAASASCSRYLISAPAFHFPPNVSSTLTFSQGLLSVLWAARFHGVCVEEACFSPSVQSSLAHTQSLCPKGSYCPLLCPYWPEWVFILLNPVHAVKNDHLCVTEKYFLVWQKCFCAKWIVICADCLRWSQLYHHT